MSILLIAGLPFSDAFWHDVQQRLHHFNIESHTWTLCGHGGSLQDQVASLHATVEASNISCIVGHGLALPLVLEYTHQFPMQKIVLTNGLISDKNGLIQWLLPRITALPNPLGKLLMSPMLSIPILSSSLCFRRLVINPYVMDKTVVQRLTTPQLEQPDFRSNVMAYLQSLKSWHCPETVSATVHLISGDHDKLCPVDQVHYLNHIVEHAAQHTEIIPGGAHFHPIERPWAIADILVKHMT